MPCHKTGMLHDQALAATLLAVVWGLCSLVHPLVRRALLDGARCLGRYPELWRIPALFSLSYVLFQFIAALVLRWRVSDPLFVWFDVFSWGKPQDFSPVVFSSLLPAAERTAAVFTIFTATFPISAVFALLLCGNFQGMLVEMCRALLKRLGRLWGGLTIILLGASALAAIVKPAVYLFLPEISDRVPIQAALAVNAFSVLFELLLGIYFLTYLMLMAYLWRRGMEFDRFKLHHLAMRRTGFALKWSLVIAALDAAFVVLPLQMGIYLAPGDDLYQACAWFSDAIGRPVVTAVALIYCPVQAVLVFHNESLRRALQDGSRILRSHWAAILPFLATAYLAFLLLTSAAGYAAGKLGPDTVAAFGSSLLGAWIEALLAGWFIAAWVSLYKSLSAGRKEIPF